MALTILYISARLGHEHICIYNSCKKLALPCKPQLPTEPAEKKGGTPKVVRTEMEEQLTAMNVVKKRYTSVISRATLILDNIAKNPDEWDMGAKCKELQSCFEQVNGLTVSGFARTLLTKDLREVKAAYPQSSFIVESKAFAAALTPAVDKLEKICSAVVNMHVEAMKSV